MRDKPPRVLVAYGSTRGGTREIAAAIVETLLNAGVDADLADAATIRDLAGYDAVLIGGALYMNRWHPAARKLVTRHVDELSRRPVWLFSSGPLDSSANASDKPAIGQVHALMSRINARGHATFGGRLDANAEGLVASRLAKKMAGDWREWHKIRAWAKTVAQAILDDTPQPVVIRAAPSRAQRWLLAGLCLFTGITAIGGGATLVLRPDGSLMEAPPGMLQHSPFATFLIPGLLLLVVVGASNVIAGVLVLRNTRLAPPFAFLAGAALFVWIVTEMILLRSHHWLQVAYLAVAVLVLVEARKVFALPWRTDGAARYAAQ